MTRTVYWLTWSPIGAVEPPEMLPGQDVPWHVRDMSSPGSLGCWVLWSAVVKAEGETK